MWKKRTALDDAFWMSMVEPPTPALVGIAWLLAPAPRSQRVGGGSSPLRGIELDKGDTGVVHRGTTGAR
jgi:hypothetical protein